MKKRLIISLSTNENDKKDKTMIDDSMISSQSRLYREGGGFWATSAPPRSKRCFVSSLRKKSWVQRCVLSVDVGELIPNLMRQVTHFW